MDRRKKPWTVHSQRDENTVETEVEKMTRKVYEAVKDMLPYGVGVYVTDDECRLALYSVKQARRKRRTRPVSEMLLMMFRSAARERGRK